MCKFAEWVRQPETRGAESQRATMKRREVSLSAVISLGCCSVVGHACAQVGVGQLNGVWQARVDYVDEPNVVVRLAQASDRWLLTGPDGTEVAASPLEDGTFLAAFGDLGSVRFEPPQPGKPAVLFWIQPPSQMLSQAHATPLRCAQLADGSWMGGAETLDDGTELFLVIDEIAGEQRVEFVEHSLNFGRFWQVSGLAVQGSRGVVFEGMEPTGEGRLESGDTMVLSSEALEPLSFTRIEAAAAVGYLPGEPGASATNPPVLNDGWVTARPEDVGLDSAVVDGMLRSLADPARRSISSTRVHSVQIARHGKLAVDAYFFARDADEPHDTRSAGKSVGSLLLGAALGNDGVADLEKPMSSLLPGRVARDASQVTLRDMVSMRSGLWADDGDPDCPAEENNVQNSGLQDWYAPVLQAPARHEPGSHFAYSSMSINIAGAVISETTNRWMPALMEDVLFSPMQIQTYHINLMPSQDAYLGGGIRLRPRDFLKIGQLVLDQGRWRDVQVVPPEWMAATTAPLTEVRPGLSYASGWWERTYEVDVRRRKTIQARGNGGQVVIACPELRLVACFIASNYGDGRAAAQIADKLAPEYVLRAALQGE